MARNTALVLALLALIGAASAKVYFQETFDDSWSERWTKSKWKVDEGTAGDWVHTAGKNFGDEEINKGIKTTPDARFFAITAPMPEVFDNEGKDLVLQFSVKHEQGLDCGGGYLKLIPASSADQIPDKFSGDTPYAIMFGPDQCGMTKKVHVIFTYKGKNLLIKKELKPKDDKLTHVYTLVVKPDNTYKVMIDLEEIASGSLYEDWDFLPPAKIADPEATKPEDWDERAKIPDPEAKKPEDWDSIPETIPDPEASKPADWDDEDDGEWEAPMIPNPEYKGEWSAPMIDNPAYKGKWEAPQIDNPEYVHDDKLYHYKDLKFLGFELWQVKAGSIFDNIMVTDDVAAAEEFAKATWGATKEAEQKAADAERDAEAAKAEEERKKADEERKKLEEEEEDGASDDGEDEEYEAEEAEKADKKDEL